jgi:hypothetical protein
MPTLDELSRALVAADKAGDAQAARILAGEITRLRARPAGPALPPLTADPTEGMSGMDKFRAGAGKAIVDLGRGVGQLVGAVSREDVAESRKRDKALMDTGAGMAGNLAGNLAALAPTAMIPGANTITGGAVAGGLIGLLQPSVSTDETVRNVAFGGAAGAAVPAAVRGGKMVKAAAEPFYERGRNAIVGRALNSAAGDDAAAVAQRLRQAGQPFVGPQQPGPVRATMGELVPGSAPTVGQAAGNPGVAALERAAAAGNPQVTNAMAAMMEGQNTARVEALRNMAGTDGARMFATEMRDGTANQLYGAARRGGVDAAALTPQAQANIASFAKRVPAPVMARARQLAQMGGEPMTNETSVQGLHWVKMALDDMISSAKRSGDTAMARQATQLQKDLLVGMDAMSPAYQQARQTFQQMSRPVNQMEVAQEITNRAVSPLTGRLQPNAYARALSDQTAARATGMQGATLENTMSNQQMNTLASILDDVRRAEAAQTVGRGVGSDTVQKLAYTNLIDQAGVPTFMRNMTLPQIVGGAAGRVADAAYGRANRELGNRLAEVMLDPAMAAELMTQASPRELNRMLQLLQRGASGAALAAPATANARQ